MADLNIKKTMTN